MVVSILKPSSSPRLKVKEEVEEASFTGQVFGATASSQATSSAEKEESEGKESKLTFPLVISLTGLSFLGIAAFPLVKPKLAGLLARFKKNR